MAVYTLSPFIGSKQFFRKFTLSKTFLTMTSTVIYQGDLRTECTHNASGSTLITDAPVDNHGKGEAFSPTDTVATSLASCLLTVMGIKARDLGVDLEGTKTTVEKVMKSNPRRIAQINIGVYFKINPDEKIKKILEKTALTCPVFYSLSESMEKNTQFFWSRSDS